MTVCAQRLILRLLWCVTPAPWREFLRWSAPPAKPSWRIRVR